MCVFSGDDGLSYMDKYLWYFCDEVAAEIYVKIYCTTIDIERVLPSEDNVLLWVHVAMVFERVYIDPDDYEQDRWEFFWWRRIQRAA